MPRQDIRVIYEDNHLLAVHKPAGVLSQEDSSGRDDILTLMKEWLRDKYSKPGKVWLGLVHRLDYATEGIMVLAKTSKAASRLSGSIRQHEFRKIYLAVAEGSVEPSSGTWRDDLAKDQRRNLVYVNTGGREDLSREKPAELRYRVRERLPASREAGHAARTLLEVDLVSGRSHQIRIQFASRGWPLAGDRRYGSPDGAKTAADEPAVALLAWEVSFPHPTTREMMTLRTSVPDSAWWTDFRTIREMKEER